MSAGAWVLVVAVLGALAFGAWRAYTDGRFRGTHPVRGAADAPTEQEVSAFGPHPAVETVLNAAGVDLGSRATLLQFSSAFCAPCRATRRVLADVAGDVDGVAHVEVDAESHLDLVRELGILRTPTTIVLDASGAEVARAAGAPTRTQVLAQLGAL